MWNYSFLMLIASAFFYFLNLMMLLPLYAGYAGSIGANGAVMGLATGISYFTAVIANPFAGALVDRTNKRLLSLLGLFFLFLSTFGYIFSTTVAVFLFFRVTHGLSFALISTAFSTSIASLVPAKKFGAAIDRKSVV